jgi:hypothetical protein
MAPRSSWLMQDLRTILRSLEPVLHEDIYAYCAVAHGTDISALGPVATVREHEGLTIVVAESQAIAAGLSVLLRAAWITLNVHSDLQSVGLTAEVSQALSQANISCNVIAGSFHDHIFVPIASAQAAFKVLQDLQQSAWLACRPNGG